MIFFAFGMTWYYGIREPVSCQDGLKNGDELGVDCGGSCGAVCKEELVPLSVVWSKVFPLRDEYYNVAALILNPNQRFSSSKLAYVFKLYDNNNILITEREGITFANANERFLIMEPQVSVGKRVPVRAFIELFPAEWNRLDSVPVSGMVSTRELELTQGEQPRLSAKIRNEGLEPVYDISVLALILDRNDNAIAVSSTFVNSLTGGAEEQLFFTWPNAFDGVAVAASIYPRLDRTK